jgi:hypothetical protein
LRSRPCGRVIRAILAEQDTRCPPDYVRPYVYAYIRHVTTIRSQISERKLVETLPAVRTVIRPSGVESLVNVGDFTQRWTTTRIFLTKVRGSPHKAITEAGPAGGRGRGSLAQARVMNPQPTHRLSAAQRAQDQTNVPPLGLGARRPNSREHSQLDRIKPICIEKSRNCTI